MSDPGGPSGKRCTECNVLVKHGRRDVLGKPNGWKFGAWHTEWHTRYCMCAHCVPVSVPSQTFQRRLRKAGMKSIPVDICSDCACKKKGCAMPKIKSTEYCADCQRCPIHSGINVSKAECKQCAKEWKKVEGIEWRSWHHKKFPLRIREQIETVLIMTRARNNNGDYAYNETTGGFSDLPNEIMEIIYVHLVEQQRPAHC